MSISNTERRFITKVALMYHEEGMNQPQVAQALGLPQTRVSRLLKLASELGIVRTTVVPPSDLHVDWERELARRYNMMDVVIAEATEGHSNAVLGSAAALYLESTLAEKERLGISSWSSSLLATVEAMRPRPHQVATEVVQMIGGVGNPTAQVSATRLITRFSEITGGEAKYLASPGVFASKAARDAFINDPYIQEVVTDWDSLTTALVGIGALDPSPLLAKSGNAFKTVDQKELKSKGAVGDICLHYFDKNGKVVKSDLESRTLGISATTFRKIPRRVGVAGGIKKLDAIRAALSGGWINVLITDSQIAAALIENKERGRK